MHEDLKQSINEYLAAEWGVDEDEVSASSPFELRHLGELTVPDWTSDVFEFFDDGGQRYFAFGGRVFNFLPAGEMTLDDLQVQELGRTWLGDREPLDSRPSSSATTTFRPTRSDTRRSASSSSPPRWIPRRR